MSEHDRTTVAPDAGDGREVPGDQAEPTASPTTEAWLYFRDGEPYGMEIDGRPYRIRPAKRGGAIRPGDRYAVIRMSRPES
jgi:hypothetical protein